ncbi:MAG: DUF2911 domain-containing protein [Acidobacteriales bacterium]|nr:DUF2911 domain-containing protein [Terriglobales bacterium]
MRIRLSWSLVLPILLAAAALAQDADNSLLTTCTLADQKEISARYVPGPSKARLPDGRVWAPGNSPIVLFTQAEMTIAGVSLPIGAYNAYILPTAKSWTFVLSKDVSGKTYDPSKDLVRVPMKSGSLGQAADPYSFVFTHDSAKQCSLQVFYGKNGYWVEFQEK